jgi:hypothetical protein
MWFGTIINIFAKIESQMMVCAAGVLDTDLATAYILMADTHYRQKRQTLLHLNSTVGVDGQRNGVLTRILNDLHKFSTLRNQIAHSTWADGRKPGAIKPMQLKLRGETPKPLGDFHNEKNYTAEDLQREAMQLETIARRFRVFLIGSGLQERVEANIEKIK